MTLSELLPPSPLAAPATPAAGYVIHVNGRARRFPTLAAAESVAAEIFSRTGIVVGIEAA